MKTIHIATEFSKFPAGRYHNDGPFSGQRFREELLTQALHQGNVTVELDGTLGYGSSFLKEAFGGLVRAEGFLASDLREKLKIHSATDPTLEIEAWFYIEEELI